MAATIKIKRSTGSGTPTLVQGELAYSAALNGSNEDVGSGKLYIGNPSTNTAIAIGGSFYTNLLSGTAGTAAASKAVILDASAGITGLGAVSANTVTANTVTGGNVQISTNTVTTTSGNLTLDAAGAISIAGQWNLPKTNGTTGYVLTANSASGTAEWLESSSTLLISGNANTGSVDLLNQTLAITGSGGISTDVSGNSIALSLSSSLTSLAGLSVTTNDLIIGTGANTFATQATSEIGRALLNTANTATAQATLALVPGTNVQAYDAGLQALAEKTSTGIMVQTGNDTYSNVEIAVVSTDRLTVSNGSGVSGNPTLDLATVANSNTGTFQKVTVDSYGRVTGTTAVVIGDIEALANNTYLRLDGAFAMTGNLNMSNNVISNVGAPVASGDAVNKNYVDNAVAGLSWKQAVRVATTANIDLTTGTLLTIDGITVSANDRVLVKNQTTNSQNGIYIAGTGEWIRSADANTPEELNGAAVFVLEGTVGANTGWTQTSELTNPTFTAVTWAQFAGGGAVVGGTGIDVVGNQVNFKYGAGLTVDSSNNISVNADGNAIQVSANTPGSTLGLVLDGAAASGLEQSATGLKISASGVTNAMLANSSIGVSGDSGSFNVSLGSGASIAGSGAISTSASGNTVTVSVATATDSVLGVASFSNATFTVTGGLVTVSNDGITNAMLVNDAITLGADSGSGSVALGTTATVSGTAAQGITTSVSGNTITVSANNASTTDKGVASFSADNFDVASGVVSIKAGGVDLATEVANTLPVGNGGTGANTFTAGQLLVGNGTSPFATSANLAFDSANNALTIGTAVVTGGTTDVTITATGTDGDINLVPNGTGTVNIGASGAGTIASSSGQTLTVTGDAGLTLAATSNDIIMTVAAGDTAKVTVAGANAIQYSTNLDNADLVNKYFVENVAVIDGGTY